jgi:hypothetical protein
MLGNCEAISRTIGSFANNFNIADLLQAGLFDKYRLLHHYHDLSLSAHFAFNNTFRLTIPNADLLTPMAIG